MQLDKSKQSTNLMLNIHPHLRNQSVGHNKRFKAIHENMLTFAISHCTPDPHRRHVTWPRMHRFFFSLSFSLSRARAGTFAPTVCPWDNIYTNVVFTTAVPSSQKKCLKNTGHGVYTRVDIIICVKMVSTTFVCQITVFYIGPWSDNYYFLLKSDTFKHPI